MKRSEGWLSGPPVRQVVVVARTRATGLRLLGPHVELNRSVAAVRHDVVSVLIQPLAAVTLGHPCGGNVRRVEAPTRIPRTSPHLLDQHVVVRLPRSAAGEGLAGATSACRAEGRSCAGSLLLGFDRVPKPSEAGAPSAAISQALAWRRQAALRGAAWCTGSSERAAC